MLVVSETQVDAEIVPFQLLTCDLMKLVVTMADKAHVFSL